MPTDLYPYFLVFLDSPPTHTHPGWSWWRIHNFIAVWLLVIVIGRVHRCMHFMTAPIASFQNSNYIPKEPCLSPTFWGERCNSLKSDMNQEPGLWMEGLLSGSDRNQRPALSNETRCGLTPWPGTPKGRRRRPPAENMQSRGRYFLIFQIQQLSDRRTER